MEVEQLTISKKKAEEELSALKVAAKQNATMNKEQIYRDLQKVYGAMRYGGRLIDLALSFQKVGLNSDGDPKLAICRADAINCHCLKLADGGAIFSDKRLSRWDKARKTYADVVLPKGTLKWLPQDPTKQVDQWNIKKENVKCIVPIIPARLLPVVKTKLSNYHILWEVDQWVPEPPKDPMLLKQLTPNLYAVLATWDLTPLERAVIRGRL